MVPFAGALLACLQRKIFTRSEDVWTRALDLFAPNITDVNHVPGLKESGVLAGIADCQLGTPFAGVAALEGAEGLVFQEVMLVAGTLSPCLCCSGLEREEKALI